MVGQNVDRERRTQKYHRNFWDRFYGNTFIKSEGESPPNGIEKNFTLTDKTTNTTAPSSHKVLS